MAAFTLPGDAGLVAHGRAGGWLLAHLIASHHHGLYDHDQLAERLLGSGVGVEPVAHCAAADAPLTAICAAPAVPGDSEPHCLTLRCSRKEAAAMFVTITSKRQVTFPARVLDALGVKPGDRLELQPSPEGFVLRAKRVDPSRLAPLRGKLGRTAAPAFDIHAFREQAHDPALRD